MSVGWSLSPLRRYGSCCSGPMPRGELVAGRDPSLREKPLPRPEHDIVQITCTTRSVTHTIGITHRHLQATWYCYDLVQLHSRLYLLVCIFTFMYMYIPNRIMVSEITRSGTRCCWDGKIWCVHAQRTFWQSEEVNLNQGWETLHKRVWIKQTSAKKSTCTHTATTGQSGHKSIRDVENDDRSNVQAH